MKAPRGEGVEERICNMGAPPKVRKCPHCGKPMRPVLKTHYRNRIRRFVKYWVCDNPNCKVVKVFSRKHGVGGRLEVVEAHAL